MGDVLAALVSLTCIASLPQMLLVEREQLPDVASSPYVSAMQAGAWASLFLWFRADRWLSLLGLFIWFGWFFPARWSVLPFSEESDPRLPPRTRVIFLLVPVIVAVVVIDKVGGEGLWRLHANLHDGLGLLYLWVTADFRRRMSRLVLDHGLYESEPSSPENLK